MIDLHSHILPGLDDGARDLEEARGIARAALADGIVAIAATPHVRFDWPTTPETMERGVEALRADLAANGIGVEVLHGGELAFEQVAELDADELRRFTLGQTGRYALVESPYDGWSLAIEPALYALRALGVTPVLAHPERNPVVQQRPALVAELVASGCIVQVTAASLEGRGGRSARACAQRLLADGLVHLLASDAHAPAIRAVGLSAARDAVGHDGLARYLTEDAPAAIAAGEPLPPRPPFRRRRFGFRRPTGKRE